MSLRGCPNVSEDDVAISTQEFDIVILMNYVIRLDIVTCFDRLTMSGSFRSPCGTSRINAVHREAC